MPLGYSVVARDLEGRIRGNEGVEGSCEKDASSWRSTAGILELWIVGLSDVFAAGIHQPLIVVLNHWEDERLLNRLKVRVVLSSSTTVLPL